jgi:hypothetical protein
MNAATSRFAGQKLLALLGEAINPGPPIATRDLWAQGFPDPAQWVLDPLAVTRANPDSRYSQAVQRIVAERERRANTMVDSGAAALDELAARAGVRGMNLAGVRKPRALYFPLADGVGYKRDPIKSKVPGQPGVMGEFVNFRDTPMLDWDIPDPSHVDSSVTVRNLGDVEELARQYVADNPESMLQLYQTPGGYRAWELGVRAAPGQVAGALEKAMVDPNYIMLAQRGQAYETPEGVTMGGPVFSSRISAKPGRTDWVAQPMLTVRGRNALPDPVSLSRVETFHDGPIARNFLAHGVSPEALRMLAAQLPTASQQLRREVVGRFGPM